MLHITAQERQRIRETVDVPAFLVLIARARIGARTNKWRTSSAVGRRCYVCDQHMGDRWRPFHGHEKAARDYIRRDLWPLFSRDLTSWTGYLGAVPHERHFGIPFVRYCVYRVARLRGFVNRELLRQAMERLADDPLFYSALEAVSCVPYGITALLNQQFAVDAATSDNEKG
jgi:hypothetical protein